MSRVRS
ncbi:hypothetical protein EC34870_3060A, partial [Escherichia coli 3.4870]